MSKDEIELPEVGEGRRGTGGHIGYLLRQAGTAFRTRLDEGLAAQNLTSPQFVALTMISAYPGLSSADLARLSLLTPQTITVIITNLKRASLVELAPHPTHGRIQQLKLTEAGAALLAECRPLVDRLEARLTEGFSDEEMMAVRRWLVAAARV
jgi:DNA-binding MarR family transcriptional regulator